MDTADVSQKITDLENELNRLRQEKETGQETEIKAEREDEDTYIPIGETGVFDGEFVLMGNEKKYQVPPNYASKSKLVVGDKLTLVSCGDFNTFKISEQIPREEITGILTKKENQWVVLVDEKAYLVIAASIRYYEGEIGDKVQILLPKESTLPVKWAAVKVVIKDESRKPVEPEEAVVVEEAVVQPESIDKPIGGAESAMTKRDVVLEVKSSEETETVSQDFAQVQPEAQVASPPTVIESTDDMPELR